MKTTIIAAVLLASTVVVGCDEQPKKTPQFVTGDEVLLAPNDEPALVIGSSCEGAAGCFYKLRLAGLKEKVLYGEIGIKKR